MRLLFHAVVGLLLVSQAAFGFAPGEKVVVIQATKLTTATGSTVALTPGTTLVVRSAADGRLEVSAGRLGSIDAAAVIPADKADASFTKLIDQDSADAVALLARGKVRFDRGDVDLAIADLDRSLTLSPTSEAYTIRGYAWKRKGDKDQAMANFDAAIRLNPREALAWRIRGATWAGKADYAKALADYSESIRIDPENPDARHHRALLLSACNDASIRNGKQAVADATKACEVSGWKNPLYLSGLATASAEAGDFDAAIQWSTKAIELSGDQQAKSLLAQRELYRQHQPFRMTWR